MTTQYAQIGTYGQNDVTVVDLVYDKENIDLKTTIKDLEEKGTGYGIININGEEAGYIKFNNLDGKARIQNIVAPNPGETVMEITLPKNLTSELKRALNKADIW